MLQGVRLVLGMMVLCAGQAASDSAGSGTCQSPIIITSNSCMDCPLEVPHIIYNEYWGDGKAQAVNNGETVTISLEDTKNVPTIEGGPLEGEYVFTNLHFHWGLNDDEGSEHLVNSEKFAMEAHIVHYKQEYGSVVNARSHWDGLTVVAFFLQASKVGEVSEIGNPDFWNLTKHLSKIEKTNATTEFNAEETLSWFHKTAKSTGYFTYHGSLTTPPYSQSVTWIVYPKPIIISDVQVNAFRRINIEGNHRSSQALNQRPVYYCGRRENEYCGLSRANSTADNCYFCRSSECKTYLESQCF